MTRRNVGFVVGCNRKWKNDCVMRLSQCIEGCGEGAGFRPTSDKQFVCFRIGKM